MCLKVTSLVLLAVIAGFLILQTTAKETKIVRFKKTANATLQFNCTVPYQALVYIDEIAGYNKPDVTYYPRAVVVHRCSKSTGCCASAFKVCDSDETSEETIKFEVQERKQIARQQTNTNKPASYVKKQKIFVSVKNHTRCDCYDINSARAKRSVDLPTKLAFDN